MSIKTRSAAVLVAAALSTATSMGAAAPANASSNVVWSTTWNAQTIQLMYNNGWNWASVNSRNGQGGELGIYSPSSNWRWTMSYQHLPSYVTTPVVWAPGSTCVTVQLNTVNVNWPYNAISRSWRVC